MARGRQPVRSARRRRAVNVETMRGAAEDFLTRFGSLVDEVVTLREALAEAQEENLRLRAELVEGITLFREAGALAVRAGSGGRRERRSAGNAVAPSQPAAGRRPRGTAAKAARAGRTRGASANGRATPASVTGDVVRAVIGKLGTASAAEIADQITAAGTPVSGRAIRHIAKAAGAVMRPGEDGRMVYSLR